MKNIDHRIRPVFDNQKMIRLKILSETEYNLECLKIGFIREGLPDNLSVMILLILLIYNRMKDQFIRYSCSKQNSNSSFVLQLN